MSHSLRVGLLAGEMSGDILGAGLMAAIRERFPDAVFEGIGGPLMIAQGFTSHHPMERLSVMGLVEPLKRLPELLRIRAELYRRFRDDPPDLFVGIDSPDFCLHLEEKLRRHGIPTAHYVSPSVWAWRQKRVRKIARAVDLMLTLFPFEAAFYEKHGIPVAWVGHPLADQVALEDTGPAARQAPGLSDMTQQAPTAAASGDAPAKEADKQGRPVHALASEADKPGGPVHARATGADKLRRAGEGGFVLALLPGSRQSEVARLAPPFLQAARRCLAAWPDTTILLSAANERREAELRELLDRDFPGLPVRLQRGDSRKLMAAADCLLLASGTVTLEALLLRRPMIVCYRMAALSYAIISRMLKVPYFSLPNLLAGEALVPELVQDQVNEERLFAAVQEIHDDPAKRQALTGRFEEIHRQLRQDASRRAAEAVLELVERKRGGEARKPGV